MADIFIWYALKASITGQLISSTAFLKRLRNQKVQETQDNITQLGRQNKATGNKEIYRKLVKERDCLQSVETLAIEKNLLYLNQLSWQNSPKAQGC